MEVAQTRQGVFGSTHKPWSTPGGTLNLAQKLTKEPSPGNGRYSKAPFP